MCQLKGKIKKSLMNFFKNKLKKKVRQRKIKTNEVTFNVCW